jgi:hypothetical protein
MLPTPLRVGSWYGMLRVMAWYATNPPQGGVMVWYATNPPGGAASSEHSLLQHGRSLLVSVMAAIVVLAGTSTCD